MLHSEGKPGLRCARPAIRQMAESSPGLPDDIAYPTDIPDLMRKAGAPWRGFADLIAAILDLADWKNPAWRAGGPVLVRACNAALADRLGVTPRRVQQRLGEAHAAGLIHLDATPDGSRRRIDLAPLVAHTRALLTAAQAQAQRRRACVAALKRLRLAVFRFGEASAALDRIATAAPFIEIAARLRAELRQVRAEREAIKGSTDPAVLDGAAFRVEHTVIFAEAVLREADPWEDIESEPEISSQDEADFTPSTISISTPIANAMEPAAPEPSAKPAYEWSERAGGQRVPQAPPESWGSVARLLSAVSDDAQALLSCLGTPGPDAVRDCGRMIGQALGLPLPVWEEGTRRHGPAIAAAAVILAHAMPEERIRKNRVALARGLLARPAGALSPWPSLWGLACRMP